MSASLDAIDAERGQIIHTRSEPFWRRWRGATERENRFTSLGVQRAELWDRWARLQRIARSANGMVREAEEKHASEVASVIAERNAVVRHADEAIARVSLVRRILILLPTIGYGDPAFCTRVVTLIEGARSKMRDPWAVNIWNIPIRGPDGY